MVSAGSGGPPRIPDSRREPDSYDDDCPTDVTERPEPVRGMPKLRLGLPKHFDEELDAGERTERISLSSTGIVTAALPRGLLARLDVLTGPALSIGSFQLTMVRTVIGRGDVADIRINDSKLSRRHFIIFYTGSEFRVRDDGSANGTVLNGSRVVEYGLRNGDELVVGASTIVFRTG